MKKNIQKLLPFLLLAMAFNSCKKDSYKSIGDPVSTLSSLAGTWKLSKVTQTDEDALRKGFPYKTLDLTTTFAYTDFVLTLNVSGGAPTTFTTTPGNSPKIIRLANGNWKVDDPKYPKVLTLTNATDTAKITLGSYPVGANTNLAISVSRNDASTGKLLVSYSYVFTKQ
ncbi:MAG: DUF5004 domain-containing protein [Chitinophagaceae bacterium]